MKRYVDGIGYIEVTLTKVESLPKEAIYFTYDDEYKYYIRGDEETVYAVGF